MHRLIQTISTKLTLRHIRIVGLEMIDRIRMH
uniref:Uncharacterized protein n=1 Tax=Podoviridae sp. ctG4L18 TaxID=2825234 RepID=A0A8S5UNS6_9CAUD|nr:MAG TPA: hypothetical protein [Podoviridae sp. ctG4L18]